MWKNTLLAVCAGFSVIVAILLGSGKLGWVPPVQPDASDRIAIVGSQGYPSREPWYVRDLPSSAAETWYKYTHRDRFEKPDSEYIPLSCWYKHIRDLDPLYVYDHRANVVVVLNVKDGMEAGKYIRGSQSSYIPQTGDDGFIFSINPQNGNPYNGILDFKRQRGVSPDIQPANP